MFPGWLFDDMSMIIPIANLLNETLHKNVLFFFAGEFIDNPIDSKGLV